MPMATSTRRADADGPAQAPRARLQRARPARRALAGAHFTRLQRQALVALARDVPVGLADRADLERPRQLRQVEPEAEIDVVAAPRVDLAGVGDLPARDALHRRQRLVRVSKFWLSAAPGPNCRSAPDDDVAAASAASAAGRPGACGARRWRPACRTSTSGRGELGLGHEEHRMPLASASSTSGGRSNRTVADRRRLRRLRSSRSWVISARGCGCAGAGGSSSQQHERPAARPASTRQRRAGSARGAFQASA